MYIEDNIVKFEYCDMSFLKKFGLDVAADMYLDFKSVNKIPFIYDTYQLADFFGIRRTNLFKVTKNIDKFYYTTTIKKRSGGVRKLNVPDDTLKFMQRCILKRILSEFKVSKYATAYKKGATLKDNARVHSAKKYVLKLDLKDFFDSITFMQVYDAAFSTRYFPKQIGVMLTTLCTRQDVLPQGTPTSPALSNLVMKNFDDSFGAWCEERGFSYTRYCDDITVSSDNELKGVYSKCKFMLTKMGFEINEKKTRFLTNGSRQTVTGLTVNSSVKVPSPYKKELRQAVYYTLKFTAADALKRDKNFERKTDLPIDEEALHYLNCLIGKVAYVLQIEEDNVYFKSALIKLVNHKDELEFNIKRENYYTF